MIKKAALLRYILFAVSILLLLTGVSAISSNKLPDGKELSYIKTAHGNPSRISFSIKTPVIKNDHIKVRYMGGDCGYYPSQFFVKFTAPIFIEVLSSAHHTSFVFSRIYLLFKLRGPPVGDNMLT